MFESHLHSLEIQAGLRRYLPPAFGYRNHPSHLGYLGPYRHLTDQPSCAHQMREENERLHATLSQDQKKAAAQSQRHINALRAQLQEQARLIASQEETVSQSFS